MTGHSCSLDRPSSVERWGGSLAFTPSRKVMSAARANRPCAWGRVECCACPRATGRTATARTATNPAKRTLATFDTRNSDPIHLKTPAMYIHFIDDDNPFVCGIAGSPSADDWPVD